MTEEERRKKEENRILSRLEREATKKLREKYSVDKVFVGTYLVCYLLADFANMK